MSVATPFLIGTLESSLYADDLQKATDFWRDIIGLEMVTAVPDRHVFFRIPATEGTQMLLVFRAEETEKLRAPDTPLAAPPHGARGPGHFCLAVMPDQLDAWREYLTAKGVPIEGEIHWPKGRSIYFRDPAGNSIELADPAIWK